MLSSLQDWRCRERACVPSAAAMAAAAGAASGLAVALRGAEAAGALSSRATVADSNPASGASPFPSPCIASNAFERAPNANIRWRNGTQRAGGTGGNVISATQGCLHGRRNLGSLAQHHPGPNSGSRSSSSASVIMMCLKISQNALEHCSEQTRQSAHLHAATALEPHRSGQ